MYTFHQIGKASFTIIAPADNSRKGEEYQSNGYDIHTDISGKSLIVCRIGK